MIGKIYASMVEFFDIKTNTTKIKSRPVLTISSKKSPTSISGR